MPDKTCANALSAFDFFDSLKATNEELKKKVSMSMICHQKTDEKSVEDQQLVYELNKIIEGLRKEIDTKEAEYENALTKISYLEDELNKCVSSEVTDELRSKTTILLEHHRSALERINILESEINISKDIQKKNEDLKKNLIFKQSDYNIALYKITSLENELEVIQNCNFLKQHKLLSEENAGVGTEESKVIPILQEQIRELNVTKMMKLEENASLLKKVDDLEKKLTDYVPPETYNEMASKFAILEKNHKESLDKIAILENQKIIPSDDSLYFQQTIDELNKKLASKEMENKVIPELHSMMAELNERLALNHEEMKQIPELKNQIKELNESFASKEEEYKNQLIRKDKTIQSLNDMPKPNERSIEVIYAKEEIKIVQDKSSLKKKDDTNLGLKEIYSVKEEYNLIEQKTQIRENHTSIVKERDTTKEEITPFEKKSDSCILALQSEIEKLTTTEKESESRILALRSHVEKLTTTEKESESRISALQSEIEEFATAKKESESRISALQSQVEELTATEKESESRILALQSEIEELATAKKESESCISALQPQIEKFTTTEKESNSRIASLQSEIEELTTAKKESESRITSLQSEVEVLNEKISAKECDNSVLKTSIANLEKEVTVIELLRVDIEKLNEKFALLKEEHVETLEEFATTRDVNKESNEQIKKLQANTIQLQEKLDAKVKDCDTINIQYEESKKIIERLSVVEEENKVIPVLEQKNTEVNEKLSLKESEFAESSKQIELLKEENMKLLVLKEEKAKLQSQVLSIRGKHNEALKKFAAINMQNMNCISDLKANIKRFEEQSAIEARGRDADLKEISRLKKESDMIRKDKIQLGEKLASLTEEHANTIEGLLSLKKESESRNSTLHSEIEELNKKLATIEEDYIKKSKAEQSRLQEKLSSLKNEHVATLEEFASVRDTNLEHKKTTKILHENNNGLQKKMDAKVKENADAQAEIKKLQKDLDKKMLECATAMNVNEENDENIKTLQEDLLKLQKDFDAKMQDNARAVNNLKEQNRKSTQMLQGQIKKLHKELDKKDVDYSTALQISEENRKRVVALQDEIDILDNEVSEKVKESAMKSDDILHYKARGRDLNNKLRAVKKELAHTLQEFINEREKNDALQSSLRNEIKMLRNDMRYQLETMEALTIKYNALQQQQYSGGLETETEAESESVSMMASLSFLSLKDRYAMTNNTTMTTVMSAATSTKTKTTTSTKTKTTTKIEEQKQLQMLGCPVNMNCQEVTKVREEKPANE